MGEKQGIGRVLVGLLVIVGGLLAVQARPVAAALYPPCGPFQPLQSEAGTCRPAYMVGTPLTLTTDRPFVWLRAAPDSPQITATLFPDEGRTLRVTAAQGDAAHWDGTQWWWQVEDAAEGLWGWVEQAALVAVPFAPEAADAVLNAGWAAGMRLMLRADVPFLWVRAAPDSDAAVRATLVAGDILRVTGGPVFDEVQWWWPVEALTARGWSAGFVEQARVRPAW
ncbi:MAG: hypothetical protein Kow0077_13190 [Anaerolineae bacterium]